MPREFTRNDRVSDALQRDLSELIRQELRDPRVGLVNITGIEVSRDLANAKVYVSFVDRDSEEDCQAATDVLNGAAGFLRSMMAKATTMRTTPRLRFIYDSTSKQGQQLSALIDSAINSDRQRHEKDSDSEGE